MKKFYLAALAVLVTASLSAKKPFIGVTTGYSGNSASTAMSYIRAIRQAGGIPVSLPPCRDSAIISETLEHLDGILLVGGEDIDPAWYGEGVTADNVEINAPRDTSDLMYINIALLQKLPVMGVCRGCQAVNVALGGTLVQDIPTQWQGSFDHRFKGDALHEIKIKKRSALYKAVGGKTAMVNSHHHQAVKGVAPGCVVTARAEDGVIEAFECSKKKVFAVQFHPETFAQRGEQPHLAIYQEFVKMCK